MGHLAGCPTSSSKFSLLKVGRAEWKMPYVVNDYQALMWDQSYLMVSLK